MIAAVYNWSGFYIGANGGWGSSHKCWDIAGALGPPKVATTRPAALPAVRSVIAGRPAPSCSVVEAQGDWADLQRQQCEPAIRLHQPVQHRCVRPVHRSGRLRLQQRAVLREGRRGRDVESATRISPSARAGRHAPATTPAGAARSASASNTASRRTGRLVSNTITCSCRISTYTFTTPVGCVVRDR